MTQSSRNWPLLPLAAAACLTFVSPAWAGRDEATVAVAQAAGKVDGASRQAGQAGEVTSESFSKARQKIDEAKRQLDNQHYDRAQKLADEASAYADLTVEEGKLGALMNTQDEMAKTAEAATPPVVVMPPAGAPMPPAPPLPPTSQPLSPTPGAM